MLRFIPFVLAGTLLAQQPPSPLHARLLEIVDVKAKAKADAYVGKTPEERQAAEGEAARQGAEIAAFIASLTDPMALASGIKADIAKVAEERRKIGKPPADTDDPFDDRPAATRRTLALLDAKLSILESVSVQLTRARDAIAARKAREVAEERQAKLAEERRRKEEAAANAEKAERAERARRDAEREREAAEWKARVARLRGSLKIGLPVESVDRGVTLWSRSKTTMASGVVETWYSEELRLSLTFIDGKLTSWTESRG